MKPRPSRDYRLLLRLASSLLAIPTQVIILHAKKRQRFAGHVGTGSIRLGLARHGVFFSQLRLLLLRIESGIDVSESDWLNLAKLLRTNAAKA